MLVRVLLLCCLLTGAVHSADVSQSFYGINAMWIPGDAPTLRERFRKARALGVSQVRLDWEWRQVEATPGTYRWDKLDELVRVAHEEGVELLPIVHYAPDWAVRPESKPPEIYQMALREDTFSEYARFLRASIRRYGPDGDAHFPFTPIVHWQVWNEPNIKQFWGPAPDPGAFSRLMQQVHRELADVRDRVRIVHAGLAKADLLFLWQLWELNPAHGETFDIMAVHPYVFDWRDGVRQPDAMDPDVAEYAALGFVGSVADPGFLGKVFNLQLFMTLRGMPEKPIWITEMGYFVGRHRLGLTEAEQATRVAATIDFIRARLATVPFGTGLRALPANVQRLYWFALEDYPSPDGMGSFGLFRSDGSKRPAADVFRGYTGSEGKP
ncbi:MAG: hypothetical protein KJZ96_05475 [Rhodocyclaceae bacterium]|jgi:hypothetical protein|nr:hypothetical protein [Rhodocyclaceae bacterium]MCL4757776.1 hypothetical protein [Rhodocyclaceae bacterium]